MILSPSGFHFGGTAQPNRHPFHPHLPSEEQIFRNYWFLQELHSRSGWSWRHMFLCADGHQAPWQSNSKSLTLLICNILLCYWQVSSGADLSPNCSTVVVRGSDGSLRLPTGRKWKDGIVSHAFHNKEPTLAAATRELGVYQPSEGKGTAWRSDWALHPTAALWGASLHLPTV